MENLVRNNHFYPNFSCKDFLVHHPIETTVFFKWNVSGFRGFTNHSLSLKIFPLLGLISMERAALPLDLHGEVFPKAAKSP